MGSKFTSSESIEGLSSLDISDYSFMRIDLLGIDRYGGRAALVGEVEFPAGLEANAPSGGRLGDIFGTFWVELFLVTDRFLEVLRSEQLSGFKSVRVTVSGNSVVPPVSMLQVLGRCGPVSSEGIGRALDPRTLDGSDIFVPANESTILLSAKAGAVLSSAGLRNVEITPAGLEAASV